MRKLLRALSPHAWVDHLDAGRWLGLSAIGLAAIAAWALPARTHDYQANFLREVPTASELRLQAVRREAVRQNATSVRQQWLAEGHVATAAAGPDGVGLWLPESVPGDLALSVGATLNEAVETLEPRRPAVTLAYLSVTSNQGGHPALDRFDPYGGVETYLGSRDGEPYCYTVRIHPNETTMVGWLEDVVESGNRGIRELGACGFYARYGLPGPAVGEWFEDGGHHYAQFVFLDQFPRIGFIGARGMFGANDDRYSLVHEACASGSAPACERLFLEPVAQDPTRTFMPAWSRRPPVASFSSAGNAWFTIALLGWLEKEHGTEAFQQFWASDAGVREAFNTAFPVTLDAWIRDMAVRVGGPVSGGPAPKAANLFSSLLFLTAGIAFSVLLARQRSV